MEYSSSDALEDDAGRRSLDSVDSRMKDVALVPNRTSTASGADALATTPGAHVGAYVLVRLLGCGGTGNVWEAGHRVSGKRVALKIAGELLPVTDAQRRLARAAKLAGAIQHPGVVQIHELLELDDGTPVLVMEMLDGETLSSVQGREGTLWPVARLVMADVVAIVRAAHAARAVHGNLNPQKVFLSKGTEVPDVRVLDFGQGRLLDSALEPPQDPIAYLRRIVGRAPYMAPEQLSGVAEFDERADVWALGAMLYECISGYRPTEPPGVIVDRQSAVPELPHGICPDRIRALVRHMLAVEPDERLRSLDGAEALVREWAAAIPGGS